MKRDQLLEHLTTDVLSYAMHGSFPRDEIASSIKPAALDERFADYDLLLDLHFVLQDEVVEFVEELPKHLRSIRTETRTTSRTRHGTVDGRIDWNSTIKKRYAEHPQDASIFVCENRSENYDIPENLVLKKLVAIIHRAVREAESYLRQDYDWVTDTWQDNGQLVDDLKRIVERNVHVRRIREPDAYEPTERMLTTAENSRQAVYRDAATLLRSHQQLHRGEPDAIRRLLDETAIAPDDTETLFELFVLFRFIATIEDLRETQPTVETITSGRQAVARFEGETELVLYHDQAAQPHDLRFGTVIDEDQDDLSRLEQVERTAREVTDDYFGTSRGDHTDRPDVIVLEISPPDGSREYLVTEVKNSTRKKTIRQGIRETLEYVAFMRLDDTDDESDGFVFGESDYFGDGWNGLLVVQDLDRETASLETQQDDGQQIAILQATELEEKLKTVLQAAVDGMGE